MTQQQMQDIINGLYEKAEENNCLTGWDLIIINQYKSSCDSIKGMYINYIKGLHRKYCGGVKSAFRRIEKV